MVIFVIIVLSLIATYLLVTSGVFGSLKLVDDTSLSGDYVYTSEMLPGMMGSPPSDTIDVYDARKPVNIPLEGAINTLIDTFKSTANTVYLDFSQNKNSVKYKEYVFSDYKLNLLKNSGLLSEDQLNKYFNVRNTIVKDINNVFTFYLDKIKYSSDRSYFTIRREILNETGTALLLSNNDIDNITNFVLSNTDVPGSIVLLIKYKLSEVAQELLDQIIMYSGYNYNTVLETLEIVLIREPSQGVSILGIVNSPHQVTINGVATRAQGFWTQVYYSFRLNNIDNFLIALIRLSFMTEQIYKAVLSSIVSFLQNPRITEAINSLIIMCKKSANRLISTFPYNFTHALIIDAIEDNHQLLVSDSHINLEQVDVETAGLSNIEKYYNVEQNFPVVVQPINVTDLSNAVEFDYASPTYPILSKDYMVNNYLSFPNISHRGFYFNRLNTVADTNGYIMITNEAPLNNLIIGGLAIYAILQDGFINTDYVSIQETVDDSNIIYNGALITVEAGKYVAPSFTNVDTSVTSTWLTGNPITIAPGNSIRIRATPQTNALSKYLRVFAVMITFITKPISNFLRIATIADRNSTSDPVKFNYFRYKNIPSVFPSLLCTFDSTYTALTTAARADTYTIMKKHLTAPFSYFIVSSDSSGKLIATANIVSKATVPDYITAAGGTYTDDTMTKAVASPGLIVDARFNPSDINSRKSYRIMLVNTSESESITINKVIMFGDISDDPTTFKNNLTFKDIIADSNVLLRNSTVTAYTLDNNGAYIQTDQTSFIVDEINNEIPISSVYRLDPTREINIEAVVSSNIPLTNRYVCLRAMYVSVSGAGKNKLAIAVADLENRKWGYVTDVVTATNNGNVLVFFNTIAADSLEYRSSSFDYTTLGITKLGFSVLPKYKSNLYSLPPYMESKFQNDYYDSYYNPISELVQYPSQWQ